MKEQFRKIIENVECVKREAIPYDKSRLLDFDQTSRVQYLDDPLYTLRDMIKVKYPIFYYEYWINREAGELEHEYRVDLAQKDAFFYNTGRIKRKGIQEFLEYIEAVELLFNVIGDKAISFIGDLVLEDGEYVIIDSIHKELERLAIEKLLDDAEKKSETKAKKKLNRK